MELTDPPSGSFSNAISKTCPCNIQRIFSVVKIINFIGEVLIFLVRPYQGFWGFREKGHLFSGSLGALANILRDLGSKQGFREQKKKTFREPRKNKSGSWGEGSIFFREQGAKTPLPGRASLVFLPRRF